MIFKMVFKEQLKYLKMVQSFHLQENKIIKQQDMQLLNSGIFELAVSDTIEGYIFHAGTTARNIVMEQIIFKQLFMDFI